MVAEARTWVDVEAAVRAWARDAVPSVERRVFYGYSRQVATSSQIAVQRIAGPDDACLIQFDVWGVGPDGRPNKTASARIAAELSTAADALGRYTFEPGDDEEDEALPAVLLHGALVEHVRWQPDEESGAARYVVEATFTATATQ